MAHTVSTAWLTTELLTGQLAPSSLGGYRRDVARYLAFCAEHHPALEAASLARWRTYLAHETRVSPSTINRRLAAIKRVVAEAASQGYVESVVAEAFRQVHGVPAKAMKERLRVRTRLTPGQMRQLCEAPDRRTLRGWRDRALLLTLASSGCRVSEVISLTLGQIRSEAGSFFVQIVGKNHVIPRLAPLAQDAYAAIEAWLARRPVESPWVFTSFAGHGDRLTPRPMHLSAAWRIVAHYADHCGLQHVSPHDCRRFVATELYRQTKDIRLVQQVLGHARIETTVGYLFAEMAGGLTDGLF